MADLGFTFDVPAEANPHTSSVLLDGFFPTTTENYSDKFISEPCVDVAAHKIDDSISTKEKLSRYSSSDNEYNRLWFIKNLTMLLDEVYEEEGAEAGRSLAVTYLRKFSDCLYYQNSSLHLLYILLTFKGKVIIAGVCESLKQIVLWAVDEKKLPISDILDSLIGLFLLVFNGELKKLFKEVLCNCCEESVVVTEMLCQSIENQYRQLQSNQPQHHLESIDLPLTNILAGISCWVPFSYYSSFLKEYIRDLFVEQDSSLGIQINLVKMIGGLFGNDRISHQNLESSDLFATYCKYCNSSKEEIRAECCEILPVVARRVSADLRSKDILSLYNAFVVDESNEVQTCSKIILGKLITAYYPLANVPSCLIDILNQLSPSSFGTTRQPSAVLEAISFCFPGIVIAVGREKWHTIRNSFLRFCKVLSTAVKKPLAAGLHEISSAISNSDCEKDIFPVLLDFLAGTNAIKASVLSHLHQTFGCFSDEFKARNLDLLLKSCMQNSDQSWLVRKEIAFQLGLLCGGMPIKLALEKILPIVIELCSDPIGIVRECALESYYSFAIEVKDNDDLFKKNVIDIIQMMKSSNIERLIRMAEKLVLKLQHSIDMKKFSIDVS